MKENPWFADQREGRLSHYTKTSNFGKSHSCRELLRLNETSIYVEQGRRPASQNHLNFGR